MQSLLTRSFKKLVLGENMEEPNPHENRNINTGGGNYNERIEGDYIQGNVFQNIFNILGGQTTKPVGDPARPKNERLLLAAVKEEVTARLRQSLHNAVLINLGKESQPQQVKRPWDAEIKIGLKPAVPLPDTTTILSVFESEEVAGKLLILGAPGSGKTTTMLDLAKALIARAEQDADYPIPVLFNLSTWKDNQQSMRDWLVLELKSKYGIRKDISAKWLDDAKLLPMLDGLDELEPVRQEPCVRKINKFLQGEWRSQYLVVCSRREEYEKVVRGKWQQDNEQDLEEISARQEIRFHLNGAILLRQLTHEQIQEYLAGLNQLELWKKLQDDTELLEFVMIPLFLSILGFISLHKTLSLQEWKKLTSNEARLHYLLDAYWKAAIKRELVTSQMELQGYRSRTYKNKNHPSTRQTRKWLVYLARQLQRSQTEFLIENIQPNWLLTEFQRMSYSVVLILIIYIILITILSGILDIFAIKQVEIIFHIVATFIFLVVIFLKSDNLFEYVKTVEKIRWSWQSAKETFVSYFNKDKFRFTSSDVSILLRFMLMNSWGIFIFLFSVFFVPPFLFIIALIHLLIAGFSSVEIENKIFPNQGIQQSAKNGIPFFIVGLLGVIVADLIGGMVFPLLGGTIGILLGLTLGSFACIQHFTLRLILYFNGYIPWNYARFLDYCTERLFLQRVGGRYRFIHKLLQDHFAQMDFKRN